MITSFPPSISGGIHIIANNAFKDVSIVNYDPDQLISGTMSCIGQMANCTITNTGDITKQWDCDDGSFCSQDGFIEPTSDPTLEPTLDPTGDPTVNPTVDPTKVPSAEPTFLPTSNPTQEPTKTTDNPTKAPTSDPTIEPTANPTVYVADPANMESGRWGLLVAMIILIVFICLIFCGWRWWSKGNDLKDAVIAGGSGGRVVSKKGKGKGKGKGSRRQNDKKQKLAAEESDDFDDGLTMGGGMIGGGDSSDEYDRQREAERKAAEQKKMEKKKKKKKKKKKSVHHNEKGIDNDLEIEINDETQRGDDVDDNDGTRKKKKKKRKKKKKEEDGFEGFDDNAGDYQKQTDNPFETNQWTELTTFDE